MNIRNMKSKMKLINRYKRHPKIDFNKWLAKRILSSEVEYFTTVLGGYFKIGEYEPDNMIHTMNVDNWVR